MQVTVIRRKSAEIPAFRIPAPMPGGCDVLRPMSENETNIYFASRRGVEQLLAAAQGPTLLPVTETVPELRQKPYVIWHGGCRIGDMGSDEKAMTVFVGTRFLNAHRESPEICASGGTGTSKGYLLSASKIDAVERDIAYCRRRQDFRCWKSRRPTKYK
jgi:hypothetical protein